jgi:hypothetical protein
MRLARPRKSVQPPRVKVCLSIAMIGLGGLQGAAALEEAQACQMEEWSGADPAKRGPLPDDLSKVGAVSAGDAAKLRDVVFKQ